MSLKQEPEGEHSKQYPLTIVKVKTHRRRLESNQNQYENTIDKKKVAEEAKRVIKGENRQFKEIHISKKYRRLRNI